MSFVATAIIGAGALGAGASIYASSQQVKAQNNAIQAMEGITGQGISTIQQLLSPFINASTGVAPTLMSLLTPGANQTATLSKLPGFQFAQDWGQKEVQNMATTRGLGGNVLTAGANYATGLAQQGWQSLVGGLQNFYNTGAYAAGTGASGIGQLLGQLSGNVGQAAVGIGNANAGGILGAAGAGGNTLSSFANLAMLKNLLGGKGGMYAPVAVDPGG